MRTVFRALLSAAFVLGVAFSYSSAADEAAPKYTIKEIMKQAHKDGLLKKIAGGQGTKEDATKLLDLYKSLQGNKPPKGEPDSWKAKSAVLVQAAQDVVDNKDGATGRLEKAANCAECHKAHKGP